MFIDIKRVSRGYEFLFGVKLCKLFLGFTGARRPYSEYKDRTNIRTKLDYFVKTGQIAKHTDREINQKKNRIANKRQKLPSNSSSALQKALLVLKLKYDSLVFQDESGSVIQLDKLSPRDLNVSSPKARVILENLLKFKKSRSVSIDERLMVLLGTTKSQLKDPYLVTRDVMKLIERDNDTFRATVLCRLAYHDAGIVGMNAVLQWLLERGDVKAALKSYNDRKKWQITPNLQTHVILFSGISKSQTWGGALRDLCERCFELFKGIRLKTLANNGETTSLKNKELISSFNACLSILMKNFEDEQYLAWSFFDEFVQPDKTLPALNPDRYTFSIFLNGIKNYHRHVSKRIKSDSRLISQQRALMLLENQSKLASTAQMIFSKVLKLATPPEPPLKEKAQEMPELLEDYRKKTAKPLIEIDSSLVSVLISCFINDFSGTGPISSLGSHYKYAEIGLEYLRIWSPEIKRILDFVDSVKDKLVHPLSQEDNSVVKMTHKRLEKALKYYLSNTKMFDFDINDIYPESIVPPQEAEINPLVTFPPPLTSKRKTKAIFSGNRKRLVDFRRPLASELKEAQEKSGNKGRSSKQTIKNSLAIINKSGLNKFHVSLLLEGLINKGEYEAFVASCWFVLSEWGGFNVNLDQIVQGITKHGLFKDCLNHNIELLWNPHTLPVRKSDKSEGFPEVDIMVIEDMIFKINENIRKDGKTSTHLIMEILSKLVIENQSGSLNLIPRYKTFDACFSCLVTDIHYFNDFNYNYQTRDKARRNVPNNTPKRSISKSQLESVIENLNKLMDILLVNESQVHHQSKFKIPNSFVSSYNGLIQRLYDATWIDIGINEEIEFHKQIIRSGILMFKPNFLINPLEGILYTSPILQSVEFVYNELKVRDDLEGSNKKVSASLKTLLSLDAKVPNALKKLDIINYKIYRQLGCPNS